MKSLRALVWGYRTSIENGDHLLALLIRAHDQEQDNLGRAFWFRSGYNNGYRQALIEHGLPVPEVLPLAPVTAPVPVISAPDHAGHLSGVLHRGGVRLLAVVRHH